MAATASEVDVEELQVRVDSQIIKSIRLEAEINNFDVPIFPTRLRNEREKIVNKSMELYLSRKNNFDGNIKEIDAQIDKSQIDVDILIRQAGMSETLMEEGVTSEFAHLNILKELNQKNGITIILVTHEKEVAAYGSRLIQMKDGVVQTDETIGA